MVMHKELKEKKVMAVEMMMVKQLESEITVKVLSGKENRETEQNIINDKMHPKRDNSFKKQGACESSITDKSAAN